MFPATTTRLHHNNSPTKSPKTTPPPSKRFEAVVIASSRSLPSSSPPSSFRTPSLPVSQPSRQGQRASPPNQTNSSRHPSPLSQDDSSILGNTPVKTALDQSGAPRSLQNALPGAPSLMNPRIFPAGAQSSLIDDSVSSDGSSFRDEEYDGSDVSGDEDDRVENTEDDKRLDSQIGKLVVPPPLMSPPASHYPSTTPAFPHPTSQPFAQPSLYSPSLDSPQRLKPTERMSTSQLPPLSIGFGSSHNRPLPSRPDQENGPTFNYTLSPISHALTEVSGLPLHQPSAQPAHIDGQYIASKNEFAPLTVASIPQSLSSDMNFLTFDAHGNGIKHGDENGEGEENSKLSDGFVLPGSFLSVVTEPWFLRAFLPSLNIRSMVSLWDALEDSTRAQLDQTPEAREEIRVWGLGWAGYIRGALTEVEQRDGWDGVGNGIIVDFLSTLLLPPNTQLSPRQVFCTSLVTLLLRASHACLPPPGRHLIPFEEEDCIIEPVVPAHTSLPPSSRTLRNGKELVFPQPLATSIQPPAPPPALLPMFLPANGSQSALDPFGGRNQFPALEKRRINRRSSMSSVASWASRPKLGPGKESGGQAHLSPTSVGSPRVVSSSASIFSIDSSIRVAPPPSIHPQPRRYEFSQQPVFPRRPTRRDLAGLSDAGSVYSSGGSPSVLQRQRNPSFGNDGIPSSHSTFYPDPNAPPVPSLMNLAWSNASNGLIQSPDSSINDLSQAMAEGSPFGSNSSFLGGVPRPDFMSSPSSSSSLESGSFVVGRRYLSPSSRASTPQPVEPLFLSATSPYRYNRAPVVEIVVPLPTGVRWPSGSALKLCHQALARSGLLSKMKLGDLVENLAISHPRRTTHPSGWTTGTMVFVPPFLQPLSSAHSTLTISRSMALSPAQSQGLPPFRPCHLPPTLDMFLLPPTYFHAVLPAPYIVFLDISPFEQAVRASLRLAHQRNELSSTSGQTLFVDLWIHEAGFYIGESKYNEDDGVGEWRESEMGKRKAAGDQGEAGNPWNGTMVTLEADGTKEGRDEILNRITPEGNSSPFANRHPWEIVGSKSTRGSVWLKLVREQIPHHQS
ncbi:hypothetical protein [Phaffia rhodozyma]|uniref:Uncharacterized protein n=1 Tax=Phaffia rhodozyma TaxID=264483 RepID=A0A0F7SFC8_PHARH|nr:hypothetical protein [Phaffia rhodozyma]